MFFESISINLGHLLLQCLSDLFMLEINPSHVLLKFLNLAALSLKIVQVSTKGYNLIQVFQHIGFDLYRCNGSDSHKRGRKSTRDEISYKHQNSGR